MGRRPGVGDGPERRERRAPSICVVADPDTQSGKAKEAREYGTRIMAEAAFWKAIGANVE